MKGQRYGSRAQPNNTPWLKPPGLWLNMCVCVYHFPRSCGGAEHGGLGSLPALLREDCWPFCFVRDAEQQWPAGGVPEQSLLQGHQVQDHAALCQEIPPDPDV